MRLAIINLTAGGLSGGYKKYLLNMIPRFAAQKSVDAILCISPVGNDVSSLFEKLLKVEYGFCSRLTLCHFAYISDGKMRKCIRKFKPDIVFFPVDRYIRFKNIPVVNMVRNMEPFIHNMKNDSLMERSKKFIQRKITQNSLKHADHTIAVSSFVKDYLITKLHIPENTVTKIYHGLSNSANEKCKRPISIPKGWDRCFLFSCGSIRPARGLEDLLEALNNLKVQNHNIRLVVAGDTVPGMKKYRNKLERMLSSWGLTDNVCWAGHLDDEEINWCYKQCDIFIMTSRIEACPNIAIEAMSHGAIIIAADNPPLPEFFLDCAVYYKAKNGRSLSEAILNIKILDDEERTIISDKSRKRSAIFSWNLTTDKTISVLTRVLKQSKCLEYR